VSDRIRRIWPVAILALAVIATTAWTVFLVYVLVRAVEHVI
jgi:hypothetical protein